MAKVLTKSELTRSPSTPPSACARSPLQVANGMSKFVANFKLHSIPSRYAIDMQSSDSTKELIANYNELTAQLKLAIEADYIALRESARKLD